MGTAAPVDTKRIKRRRGGMTRRMTDITEKGGPPSAQTNMIAKAGMARRGGAISVSAAPIEAFLLTTPSGHALSTSSVASQVCKISVFVMTIWFDVEFS